MDYVLPLKASSDTDCTELAAYVRGLAAAGSTAGDLAINVTVVDGSTPSVFERNRRLFGADVTHLRPAPELRCSNGKVAGVRTGLRMCRGNKVVVADDDVRYDLGELRRLAAELDHAELVRPQNYFAPLPWHARWDTGRTLLNRALGGDYPGTLALRLTPVLRECGYDGDVLFENLELIRTVRVAGGRDRVLADLYVRRLPPNARHFCKQRVRQAYDSLAQPGRLFAELSVLPVLALLVRQRAYGALAAGAGALVALAELGRRRSGGRAYFPATSALWVLPWLTERACCVWIALGLRLSGRGVGYSGGRILRAANSMRRLRKARAATVGPPPGE